MKLSGTGFEHHSDECEISVQEQRFSGGVQGPAKPAAKGFAADKPASGSRPFECGPFNRLGTSPNLCYIPGPDPPTNSAGGNREEQQDRTSNIIQFELGWNPHGSKGFSRLALRIGNLISSPVPRRLSRKRAGQSWSVCPRFFGGVKPFSRGQSPKNGFGTNQTGIPRFGPVWQDFLEKCKISCKIIGGRFAG